MFAKPLHLGIWAIAAAGAWAVPQAAVAQCHDYVVRRADVPPVVVHRAPVYVATYPVYTEPVYVERPVVVAERPYYGTRLRTSHRYGSGKYEYKEKWDGGRYKYKEKWDGGKYRYKESRRGKHRSWHANVHVGRGYHGKHVSVNVRRYR